MEEKDLQELQESLEKQGIDVPDNTEEDDGEITKRDYQKELVDIIRSNASPKKIKEKVLDYHENDIAAVLELLTAEERQKLYRMLDTELLADVFDYLEDDAAIYFQELNARKKVDVISWMETDTAISVLKALERGERSMLIDLMDDEAKHDIAIITAFDEDEIGSRMTTNFIVITTGLTVKEAMHQLVKQAEDNDNISTIYVTDEQREFYGAIDLKDLIIARENSDINDIIMTSYPYLYANEAIESCIERLKDYSEDSIPVLNNENKILGVITSQDFVKVVDDEMGEDYARLAGLAAEEELNESLKDSVSKRLPWLMILLALGMFVSSVVGLFESVVAELTIVISFQSLILGMAGNVGTQSLAVTIRVLMDEELDAKKKLGLVFKEARIGFCNGLILGSIAFMFIGLYISVLRHNPVGFSFAISGCIGAALLLAMIVSSLSGTLVPLFFKKIGVDPAVASGPLITTLNDLCAVITYYGLTWILLINMLHIHS